MEKKQGGREEEYKQEDGDDGDGDGGGGGGGEGVRIYGTEEEKPFPRPRSGPLRVRNPGRQFIGHRHPPHSNSLRHILNTLIINQR